MTTVRRRHVIRPATPPPSAASLRLPRLRARLDEEQQGLARWLAKLKRAFHSFEKHQLRAARLEKQIRQLEET